MRDAYLLAIAAFLGTMTGAAVGIVGTLCIWFMLINGAL